MSKKDVYGSKKAKLLRGLVKQGPGLKGSPAYTHMKQDEVNLAKRWKIEGKGLHDIAELLERDPKTIRKHMCSTQKKIAATFP